MQLVKVKDDLYIPSDFSKNHYYYADPEGKKKYTGISSIIGVLAKPALIGWAARMACEFIRDRTKLNEAGLLEIVGTDDEWEEWEDYAGFLASAQKAHTRKKEAAGAHGTDTHALIERYVNDCINGNNGEPMAGMEQVFGQDNHPEPIKKFVDWAWENVDKFLFAERRMANSELFIAGTADFAYVDKQGRRVVSDFKTSSSIWDEYWYQVASYRLLAEAEGDEEYDYMTVVRLGKDEVFEVASLYDYETAKNGFLALLTVYRTNAQIPSVVVH